mmetsp:Transcript_4611/g.6826  ORF Transcript_4611/g.6826 Transcript_4611/m.6826 type:complete len:288 (+) Transcript_4611:3-866(+)
MQRDDSCKSVTRRKMFSSAFGSAAFVAALVPQSVRAEDPLFRPNPLTNKFLEKMRIIDQDVADNIHYEGELAPPQIRSTYASLLVPILDVQEMLKLMNELVNQSNGAGLVEAQGILSQPKYQTKELKRIFNAFADNIYYSDPDRANLYLAGGATPKNAQSVAYLLRNDVLTNLEDLRSEIAYQLKVQKENGVESIDASDLMDYGSKCYNAMLEYIALVPPEELKMAREMAASNTRSDDESKDPKQFKSSKRQPKTAEQLKRRNNRSSDSESGDSEDESPLKQEAQQQ